jgi:hypothetical protein
MKIVSIKKRNWFMRFLSLNHYRVGIKYDCGIKYYNVWAGLQSPNESSLLWDLKNKIEKSNFSSLIGREL